jgi:hypothetical protein
MGAPMGNQNARKGGGGTSRMRRASANAKRRSTMSKLTGKKPKMTKMQLSIARGKFLSTGKW